MWGQVVAFAFVPLCLTCKYSANAFEATLRSPAKGQWLSIKVLQSWKSCWVTREPTHPLLWNRRRLTKLVDGTQSAPRPPDFPAEVSGPTPRRLLSPKTALHLPWSLIFHSTMAAACQLGHPLYALTPPFHASPPILFCLFVCLSVFLSYGLWFSYFQGEIWPLKKKTSTRDGCLLKKRA